MKSRLLAIGVAILGFAIISTSAANAAPRFYYNSGDGGDWSAAHWYNDSCDVHSTSAAEPTSSDAVTICEDEVVSVTNNGEVAKSVYLESPTNSPTTSTEIQIDPDSADATLTLGSGASALMSTLEANAEIRLLVDPDGSNVARLVFVTVNHTIVGPGEIIGADPNEEFRVDGVTVTLNSTMTVSGELKVRDGASAGTFDNDGAVISNIGSGTLDLEPTTITGSGSWQVTASGAVLRFLTGGTTSLSGDFTVSDGTLRAGSDPEGGDTVRVCTTASNPLSHTGGDIIAGNSDSFCFHCSCP